jgi:Methylene-tetrahydrofolate reductase C terminal
MRDQPAGPRATAPPRGGPAPARALPGSRMVRPATPAGGGRGAVPAGPRPARPRAGARLSYALHRLVAANGFYRRLAAALERHPRAGRAFTAAERAAKGQLYGCRMCGQCALPATGYACPMSCPKQLRNGPCGGVSATGACEVYPELRCVWVTAVERAGAAGHDRDLDLLQRPVDHRESGRSSWVNYWQGRDGELWVAAPGGQRPPLRPPLPVVPR